VDVVIPHEQSILSSPIPRRVESAGFEIIKRREDIVDVEIAMFGTDDSQAYLEVEWVAFSASYSISPVWEFFFRYRG